MKIQPEMTLKEWVELPIPKEGISTEMERYIQRAIIAEMQEFAEKRLSEAFESLNRSDELDNLYYPLRMVVMS